MQKAFLHELRDLVNRGEKRALLVSATGTGKTYASAFAVRELNPRRMLFLVHREQIARKAMESYRNVFGDTRTYGLVSGFLYQLFPKKIPFIYVTLIISMLCGRIIWGIAMFCCMGLNLEKFGLTSFWLGGFVNAIPGIIVQIVIIPIIIMVYSKLKKQSN